MLRIDMLVVLVPATWKVPGAGPMPTTPNKDNAEGRVEPVPADVEELVSAGTALPGACLKRKAKTALGEGSEYASACTTPAARSHSPW